MEGDGMNRRPRKKRKHNHTIHNNQPPQTTPKQHPTSINKSTHFVPTFRLSHSSHVTKQQPRPPPSPQQQPMRIETSSSSYKPTRTSNCRLYKRDQQRPRNNHDNNHNNFIAATPQQSFQSQPLHHQSRFGKSRFYEHEPRQPPEPPQSTTPTSSQTVPPSNNRQNRNPRKPRTF